MPEDVKPVAEPSAAEPNTTLTPSIREQWNKEHMPQMEKSATPDAPKAAKSEGKPESATDSETVKETQEKGSKKLTADERIAQLEATIEKIRKSSGKAEPKQAEETKAEPVTRQPVLVKAAAKLEAPKEPDMADPQYAGEDGWKKYDADVKKYNREFAEYSAKQAVENYKREQAQEVNLNRVQEQIKKGRETYADFEQKTAPVFEALIADLDGPVSKVVGVSPVFEHLMYTIGGDSDFLALAKSDPLAAVKKVGVMEALIMEELAKAKTEAKESKEPKEEKKTPVEPVTRAPKPPSEVGGRATTADDEGQQAAKSGDFRSAKAAWTRDYVASNK